MQYRFILSFNKDVSLEKGWWDLGDWGHQQLDIVITDVAGVSPPRLVNVFHHQRDRQGSQLRYLRTNKLSHNVIGKLRTLHSQNRIDTIVGVRHDITRETAAHLEVLMLGGVNAE